MVVATGRVHALHSKPETPGQHGLPKPARDIIDVDANGVVGDYNRYRQEKLRGDPDSALLLLPLETLRELQADGWPVLPGHVGENVTIEGVPYASFQPGTAWRIGDVEIRVTRACDPCKNLYALPYVGPLRGPAFVKTTMGRRGWYAAVTKPGRVRRGDVVEALDAS